MILECRWPWSSCERGTKALKLESKPTKSLWTYRVAARAVAWAGTLWSSVVMQGSREACCMLGPMAFRAVTLLWGLWSLGGIFLSILIWLFRAELKHDNSIIKPIQFDCFDCKVRNTWLSGHLFVQKPTIWILYKRRCPRAGSGHAYVLIRLSGKKRAFKDWYDDACSTANQHEDSWIVCWRTSVEWARADEFEPKNSIWGRFECVGEQLSLFEGCCEKQWFDFRPFTLIHLLFLQVNRGALARLFWFQANSSKIPLHDQHDCCFKSPIIDKLEVAFFIFRDSVRRCIGRTHQRGRTHR